MFNTAAHRTEPHAVGNQGSQKELELLDAGKPFRLPEQTETNPQALCKWKGWQRVRKPALTTAGDRETLCCHLCEPRAGSCVKGEDENAEE